MTRECEKDLDDIPEKVREQMEFVLLDKVKDAMDQARELVSDWSVYDNDGDGRVELVCVIFAGFGQNQGGDNNTIWAKASVQNLKLNDDLHITRFNCCSELFHPQYPTYINGTGVFIHEFSHCLGLPDFYNTRSQNSTYGMGRWSLMCNGCYNDDGFTPIGYSAYEKHFMGWIEYITPVDSTYYTLEAMNQKDVATAGPAHETVRGPAESVPVVLRRPLAY